MNSIPVYFLLSFAIELTTDAERQVHKKDYQLADAWVSQASGIQRAVDDYNKNGGELTDLELKALVRLERIIEAVSQDVPSFEDWPHEIITD